MPVIRRRSLLAAPALLLPATAHAQTDWPNRPITFLVGFAAGGVIDYVARLLARELAPILGQNVVVENRTGASGNLATLAMLRAPADGHTIGFAAIHIATNPALLPIGYDPMADLLMVTQMSTVPVTFLCGRHTPYRSVADVVAAARQRPGDVTFGSGGIGTSAHLAAELFSRRAGYSFLHVPFRGGAQSMQAMLAGQIECVFTVAEAQIPGNVASGEIRGLAVMQDKRLKAMPDVPAIAELGYGPEVFITSWHGIMMRAGTPPAIVARLHDAVRQAIALPAMVEGLDKAMLTPAVSGAPEEFDAFYKAEMARWGDVIREAGIKAQ